MKCRRGLIREDIVEIVNSGSELYPLYTLLDNRFLLKFTSMDMIKVKDFLENTDEFINGNMDYIACEEPVKGYTSQMYKDIQKRLKDKKSKKK